MRMTKYEIKMTNKFKKDLKKIKRRNLDIDLLNEVVLMLANDIPLPEKYNNHLLKPKRRRYLGMSYRTRLVTWISEKW